MTMSGKGGGLVPHMKLSHRCEAQPPKGGAVARNTPFAVTFEPVLVKPSMPEMDSGGSPPPPFSVTATSCTSPWLTA